MRVGVVCTRYGDGSEEGLIARRIAGALACKFDVEVLLANSHLGSQSRDGAIPIRHLAAQPERPRALLKLLRGLQHNLEGYCTCGDESHSSLMRDLWPHALQKNFVRFQGGYSPQLFEVLGEHSYDRIVFIGYSRASTFFGLEAVRPARPDLPRERRAVPMILVPAARDEPWRHLPIYDPVFHLPDRILVITEFERSLLIGRLPPMLQESIVNIGFPVQVNRLAADTEPVEFGDNQYIVIPRDRTQDFPLRRMITYGSLLERDFKDIRLALVGAGWRGLLSTKAMELPRAVSRSDAWRWVSRALAVLDPELHRLIGREALESMLFGTPVLVPERGGATREHAERGNGGLWFRDYWELRASIEALLDADVRDALGRQAQDYAKENYADSDAFVDSVAEAVSI
jgi:glycosyltransferase involved in cell wall biosynthesis